VCACGVISVFPTHWKASTLCGDCDCGVVSSLIVEHTCINVCVCGLHAVFVVFFIQLHILAPQLAKYIGLVCEWVSEYVCIALKSLLLLAHVSLLRVKERKRKREWVCMWKWELSKGNFAKVQMPPHTASLFTTTTHISLKKSIHKMPLSTPTHLTLSKINGYVCTVRYKFAKKMPIRKQNSHTHTCRKR